MSTAISAAISIASVLLIGTLLIVAHELGHFGAARALGVTARRVDRRGTEWTLALLPVGGYVGVAGETDSSAAGGYAAQPPLARMAIIVAGPVTNLLLAFIVFAGLLAIQGRPALLPVAAFIAPNSAAAQTGLTVGDRIVAVAGRASATFEELRPVLQASPGKTLDLRILRDNTPLDLAPRLGSITLDGKVVGYLGVQVRARTYVHVAFKTALREAAQQTWGAIVDTIDGIAQAVTTGRGTENFAGVLGITQLAGQAAVAGDTSIFRLIAILSANLALTNLLPIPVLDGGAFLFCAAEWTRGRPVSAKLQDVATRTGVATMAAVFMLSMLHDLAGLGLFRFFGGP